MKKKIKKIVATATGTPRAANGTAYHFDI